MELEVRFADWDLAIPLRIAHATFASAHTMVVELKDKLAGDGDLDRVRAVRNAHPRARIFVDANQGWSERHLREYPEELARLGVSLIEQPLPAGADESLRGLKTAVPLCADESCQAADSMVDLVGKYQYANLKLDKSGGLTEALCMAAMARRNGMGLMVGCMLGTSLAMAPAFVLGQLCDLVDLDAPLLLAQDCEAGLCYHGNRVQPPTKKLWG